MTETKFDDLCEVVDGKVFDKTTGEVLAVFEIQSDYVGEHPNDYALAFKVKEGPRVYECDINIACFSTKKS